MPHSAQLPGFSLPIKWLMHRVAGYNRRLRFSLTPKNFCCFYIFPSQPVKRKTYSYDVDETTAYLDANAEVYLAAMKPMRS